MCGGLIWIKHKVNFQEKKKSYPHDLDILSLFHLQAESWCSREAGGRVDTSSVIGIQRRLIRECLNIKVQS